MAPGGSNIRQSNGQRLRVFRFFFLFFALAIVIRLFVIQVMGGGEYRALAEEQHASYEQLVPRRGNIFARDAHDETWYPIATTSPRALVFADPREVEDPITLGRQIAQIVGLEDDVKEYDQLTAAQTLRQAGRIEEAQMLEQAVLADRAQREGNEESETPTPIDETTAQIPPLGRSPMGEPGEADVGMIDTPLDPVVSLPIPSLDNNEVSKIIVRLSKKDDPYEPLAHNVTEEQLRLIEALKAKGIYADIQDARAYPESAFGGHVLGFLGRDEEGNPDGNYGLEGYFDEFLSGTPGSLYKEADVTGRWIGVGDREFTPAIDGGNLYLTIDRTLQIVACGMLKKGVADHDADGGALVILEPKTGKVLAMCGAPDFDPADYGDVDDIAAYTNPTIFQPYEPGSIFKAVTMAAGIDTGAVTPDSVFHDTGSVDVGWIRPIKNAADKVFGTVTMVEALEESINTAMVWTMRQMGKDTLKSYIEKFGFGQLMGIELNTEVAGTIESLSKEGEVYAATASFGQGITVTPLQIATAYAAMANGGQLMKPYIVEKKEYPDGTVEEIQPQLIRQVMSADTAKKIAGMLVAVVEYGHGKRAAVPGYYIAGKTGTAQIAKGGVYSTTEFNGSFAGFGPVEDPKFVMVVKVENPKKGFIYAESTAAPIFGEIAAFLLRYYDIPPTRE